MSIKINIKKFECEEEEHLNYKSENTTISKLIENIALKMEEIEEFKNPIFRLDTEEAECCGVSEVNEDIYIDLILIDNKEIFDFFNTPDNSLGFHAITSGIFEEEDQDFIARKHRVFVMVDEKQLSNHIKEERENQIDPESTFYDIDYLKSYLVTVTHELAHCYEFITNANGLTPVDIYNFNECGDLSYDIEEISTGHGILFEYNEELSKEELIDIMEERVEDIGIKWLDKINIDQSLIEKALNEYSPKSKNIENFIKNKDRKNNKFKIKK